jgi:hypothetical protein
MMQVSSYVTRVRTHYRENRAVLIAVLKRISGERGIGGGGGGRPAMVPPAGRARRRG